MTKNFGFGILEVVVALAIAMIGFLAVSQLIGISQNGQISVSQSIDFDVVRSGVLRVLSGQYCDTAFADISGAPATYVTPNPATESVSIGEIVQKVNSQNVVIAQTGADLGHNLKLKSITLSQARDQVGNVVADQLNFPAPGLTAHFVSLYLTAARGSGYGGKTLSNFANPFKMILVTDTSNKIVSCGGMPPIVTPGP